VTPTGQPPQQPPEDEQEPQQLPSDEDGGDEEQEQRPIESAQLKYSKAEKDRLTQRVLQDYQSCLTDHNRRMDRWAEYFRRWSGTPDQPEAGNEDKSNMPVPYIRWEVVTKLAKTMDSLFGDDAQIVAVPVGPADFRRVKKIGLYMTWRVFNSMKLLKPFCVFLLRMILFGRAVAYSPYVRRTYKVRGKEVVDYEGPGFEPLWPDDWLLPAEEHESLHDFSFCIRKVRVTPQQLLEGEEEGRYVGIKKNFANILQMARNRTQREPQGEQIKIEGDEASGVQLYSPQSAGDTLLVLEWYGRWRPLKSQARDSDEYDIERRELEQYDLKVSVLPDMNCAIGCQDLAELYPELRQRRPFVEGQLMADGSYWSPGFGKMLIDIEDDLRANHNLGVDAGEITVGPIIFYKPASGFDKETFTYGPKMMIPVDNPATDVRVERPAGDPTFTQQREQTLLAYGERLSGQSDMALGRQSDRPNAPKTARGTVALLEEGNVRVSLDTKILREEMSGVIAHFWELEFMFSPEQMFFRVTDDDANGLFKTNDGFGQLSSDDRDGRYDFKMEFATSLYAREAEKERTLQRYGLDIQNPLIVQNPAALWKVTRDAHEALGDPDFDQTVPEPPSPDMPVNPKREWALLLEGEDIHVNPLDNDELHMMRHMQDLKKSQDDPNQNAEAHQKLMVHYHEHVDQIQHKKIVQALTEAALQQMQQMLPPQVAQMLTQQAQLGAQQPPGPGGRQPGAPGAPQQ
jgi:hypothetical protein